MSRLSCPTPSFFQAQEAGNWRSDLLNVKESIDGKEQKPWPPISWPCPVPLGYRSQHVGMQLLGCVYLLASPVSWFLGYQFWGSWSFYSSWLCSLFAFFFLRIHPHLTSYSLSVFLIPDLQQPHGPALPCAMVASVSTWAAPHRIAGWPGASGIRSWSVCFTFHPWDARRHWRRGWMLHCHLLTGRITTGFLTCPQVFLGKVALVRWSVLANELSGPVLYGLWAKAVR